MNGRISISPQNKITLTMAEASVADYSKVANKPRINGVELVGDLTSDDLHLSGGGGFNYEAAVNKPQIEGVELTGNRTLEQLGVKPMSVQEIERILYLNV